MKLKNIISYRVFHVWRRDLDVYLTTWYVNFLPALLEPLFYLFAFSIGFGTMITKVVYHGSELSYIQFFAPGIISLTILYNSCYECMYGSFIRMYFQKTFDAIIVTPLNLEEVVTGEILWGATKGAIAASCMLVPISLFGLLIFPNFLLVPVIGFIGGFMFACAGMCFTGICPTIDTLNFPVFFLFTPLMLFSGIFFPMELLPVWARNIAWLLPLTHLGELIRCTMLDMLTLKQTLTNLGVLMLFAIALFPVALALLHRRLVH